MEGTPYLAGIGSGDDGGHSSGVCGDSPFHTYYMTVSGHMNYTFSGNYSAYKNKDRVAHLQMGENARAYLACQIELDLALENLLSQLEAAGQLENTVIALSADHYPYGLEPESLAELNGGQPVDMTFDVYRSTFILWSGDMQEPVDGRKALFKPGYPADPVQPLRTSL